MGSAADGAPEYTIELESRHGKLRIHSKRVTATDLAELSRALWAWRGDSARAAANYQPVVLYFADGSTAELRGHGDYVLRLYIDCLGRAQLRPQQVEQLDLIRRSVGAREPGGARMTEVVRCILAALEQEQDSTLVGSAGS